MVRGLNLLPKCSAQALQQLDRGDAKAALPTLERGHTGNVKACAVSALQCVQQGQYPSAFSVYLVLPILAVRLLVVSKGFGCRVF